MASPYNTLLDGVVTGIGNLSLLFNSVAIAVVKAKAPKARDGIDAALPAFYVVPGGRERREPWFTNTAGGVSWRVTYPVVVALIAAGNLDLVTNLDSYLDWRNQVLRAFEKPPIGALIGIVQIDLVSPDAVIEASLIPDGFDFSALRFDFIFLEDH